MIGKHPANYARALFSLKSSDKEIQERQEQLEQLARYVRKFPKLLYFLGCPDLSIDERLKFIHEKLKVPLAGPVLQLVKLLLARGRVSSLPLVAKEYHKLAFDHLHEADVRVTAANPLSEKAKEDLKRRLETKLNKRVHLDERIDKSLLCGFSVQINNERLDLSVKGKINQLMKAL